MRIASSPLCVSVVGYGYWGPKIIRNVLERSDLRLVSVCERNQQRAADFSGRHPGIPVTQEMDSLLVDPGVEALLIATPPNTHYELARRGLSAGKHVLVEKPLATRSADAAELIELAGANDLVLMPGHTFVYSPPVNKVRELLEEGVVGEVYFVTSTRMNLGIYQPEGVVCDLAPHDLSILLYWLDDPIVQVSAHGRSIFRDEVTETAFLTFSFSRGTAANVQISWLAPRKVRQMVIVGSKRMIQYEDTAGDESVRVYDRGLDFAEPSNFGEYRLTYRTGDMVVPRVDPTEPLSLELEDFANAIRTGEQPRSHADLGLEIVLAMEAAESSLRQNGHPVSVPLENGNVAALCPARSRESLPPHTRAARLL